MITEPGGSYQASRNGPGVRLGEPGGLLIWKGKKAKLYDEWNRWMDEGGDGQAPEKPKPSIVLKRSEVSDVIRFGLRGQQGYAGVPGPMGRPGRSFDDPEP